MKDEDICTISLLFPLVMGRDEWLVGNRGVLLRSTDDASTCRHAETGF